MNKIRIDLKKGRIKEYEVLSLSHEIPDFMIPVSFVDYGDVYSATYDYSGFTSIANAAMPLGVRDVLDCLESIVIAYRKAHTYLLFPDRFTLNSDTVYVNPEKREIRLLFLPPEEDITSSEELLKFIVQLKEMGDCN